MRAATLRSRRLSLLCAAALITLPASITDAGSRGRVVSQFHLSVQGMEIVNDGVNKELVDFTGNIHMVVSVQDDPAQPVDPCRFHVNLYNFTGIGQETGQTYRVTGSVKSEFLVPLPTGVSLIENFDIISPRGVPPNPTLPIQFDFSLDDQGRAYNATALIGGVT